MEKECSLESPLRLEAALCVQRRPGMDYSVVHMTQVAVQKSLKRPLIEGMRCAVSQFAAQKLLQLGVCVCQ